MKRKTKNQNFEQSSGQQQAESEKRLYVGIDWANDKHDITVVDQGQFNHRQVDANSSSVNRLIETLSEQAQGRTITVCIEKARIAILLQLLEHDHIEVYAVDPKLAARYRESHVTSGAKNDPHDSGFLAQLIRERVNVLKPLKPDDELTRELQSLTRFRRKSVERRKGFVQQLTAQVKLYHAPAMALFTSLDTLTAMDFLRKYPDPAMALRAHPNEIKKFLGKHRIKNQKQVDAFVNKLKNVCPITTDRATIQVAAIEVVALLKLIVVTDKTIAEADELILSATAKHPDVNLYKDIPGAGVALRPRLMTVFGSDRDRFNSADETAAFTGIAPVTIASGKKSKTIRRRATNKFLMQTLVEFARSTSQHCQWARAYYRWQRSKGMAHQAAVRKLASRWNRILFRVWKDRVPYDDHAYLQNLISKKHPITKFLESQ